jgi:hypothetical protein
VFSDNIQWSRDNLNLPGGAQFIDINHGRSPNWDLRLMATCKHHINSNSTFSWWAAWLGKHKNQLVIVPDKWFIGLDKHIRDIYPDDWIEMPAKPASS